MSFDTSLPFNFLPIPTDVHFGPGISAALPTHVHALGARKVFIVTDPGVRQCGIVDRVTDALEQGKIPFDIYDRVTADSGSTLICEAIDGLKSSGADVIVGVGGGSALDTAKAVAALATNPGSPLAYVGLHKVKNRPLPTVAIPTTAGTGSEVSFWSVFTDDSRQVKVAMGGLPLFPTVALCDPDLTAGLPAALTASTGMDALAHAIECYTNKACQLISASLALRAIELIGGHLRGATLNGATDRASRAAMLLASTMAGMAMNSTRLGLAHALAMPLGSWGLKIPHSIAIAVTLPLVMEFNHVAAPERFAAVARALGESADGSPADAARRAPAAVARLACDIGIPKGLSAFGLREEHVDSVIEEAMKSGNVGVNPRSTSREELADILRKAI